MLDIALLPGEYAVCRLEADVAVPAGLRSELGDDEVVSASWTADALSLVCPADRLPPQATIETSWRCLRVVGPVDVALTGVLAALVTPLTDARVNVVAFSTYDTDYLLIPTVRLTEAVDTLTRAGHRIVG